jgi:hypothetical protein
MVTAGGVIYAISRTVDDERSGVVLWRSLDGVEWSEVEVPQLPDEPLAWVYLTGGHDRLMLALGLMADDNVSQELWTSTDGERWETVDLPSGSGVPAIPQATDFGWMIQSLGGPEPGWYQYDDITVLLSGDGLHWSLAGDRWGARGGILVVPGPSPMVYEAGLFARRSGSLPPTSGTHVWRLVSDQ